MIVIRMNTGETRVVTPNEAHGLVDSGLGVIVRDSEKTIKPEDKKWYETREMRTSPDRPVQQSGRSRDIPSKKSAKTSKTYKSK